MTTDTPLYLIFDCETRGLDENDGPMLEVAWSVTHDLSDLPEVQSRLIETDWAAAYVKANAFVQEMHTKNGLWSALGDPDVEKVSLFAAAADILKDIEHDGPVYLVGNSIRLDRAFIVRWMPPVDEAMHYRQIDLTSVRLFLEAQGLDTTTEVTVVSNHRAAGDVRDSWAYAQHLAELVMKPREALKQAALDLDDMVDSLDEHVTHADIARALSELRDRLRSLT